ncbi:MAG: cytochrome c biogenesis protein ResB [Candidatus Krumholzibacteriota bacterium]|nr:cytochrome c biogenesis protein ResB [Candidatus Krumholzibacteriota bacterium]
MSEPGRKRALLRALGSLRIAVILGLAAAAAVAAATFVEARLGTPAARALVYETAWFEILLAAFALNLIASLVLRLPSRPAQLGGFLLHLSFLVILASAALTRHLGQEGFLAIRVGETADAMQSTRDHVHLGAGGDWDARPLRLWRAGPADERHRLRAGGEEYHLAVTGFWPHYAEALVPAASGRPALRFATAEDGGVAHRHLSAGESNVIDGVRLHFLDGAALPVAPEAAPYGILSVRVNGEAAALPVTPGVDAGAGLRGGWFVRIVEFHADYARRGENPEPGDMANPMLRVQVEAPDGRRGDRVLFAYFPDFTMEHAGGGDAVPEVELRYDYERRLDLALAAGGPLRARANFAVEVLDLDTGEPVRAVAAGDSFTVAPQLLLRGGDFALLPVAIMPAARLEPVLSEDPGDPPALRVRVADAAGRFAEAVVRYDESGPAGPGGTALRLGGRDLHLAYGPRRVPLPYRLRLDEFRLQTYPGSDNPAGYESRLQLVDPERGIAGRPVRVWMNHPFTHRGYKHFQASYDEDLRGTVLQVSHDPGRWPTYIGYALLTLGFALVLVRRLATPAATGERVS